MMSSLMTLEYISKKGADMFPPVKNCLHPVKFMSVTPAATAGVLYILRRKKIPP